MEGMKTEPGNVLAGKYEIQEILGEGASGVVYLAWDRHLLRQVAIKKQKRNENSDDRSFRQELTMLKELKHPMLPALYDYFWEKGWYLVMEYVQGISLHNYIDKTGGIEEKQALVWALQIAELLCYLHDRKPAVIYRDLKPDNIMVCPDGKVRLIDFGSAYCKQGSADKDKILAGTVGYAAPEQLSLEKEEGYSDERSDIYTFGRTIYHMLTGHDPSAPPYGIRPIRRMNPELSPRTERFVERCTMLQPKQRFQTMEEVIKELKRLKQYSGNIFWKGSLSFRGGFDKEVIMKRLERKIWLTQKQGVGLLGLWILLGGIFAACAFFTVMQLSAVKEGKRNESETESETVFPVTIYNDLGQKILLRKGSVYHPKGNLILELEQENFVSNHLQLVSVSLMDCYTGMRQERVFYIRGE